MAFGPTFFGPRSESVLAALFELAKTNDLPGVHRANRSHTVLALFDEPLTGATVVGEDALPRETLGQIGVLAGRASERCDALASGHPRELTLREMVAAGHLTSFAARKTALCQEIRAALHDPNLTTDQLLAYERSLRDMDVALEHLRAEFETLWLARARVSEIHVALSYFAGLRVRFQAAIDWIADQRDALAEGRPLDADLQSYDTGGYRTLWQTWSRPGRS